MSSRDKILSQVKSALKNKVQDEDNNFDEKLLDEKIEATIPISMGKLVKQFEVELEKVNAEFVHVKNLKEAAAKILDMLSEGNESKISTTNQEFCVNIKNQINTNNDAYQFIAANDYQANERKEIISKINTSIVQSDFAVSELGAIVFCYDNSLTSHPHFLADYVIAIVDSKTLHPNQFSLIRALDKEKLKNMVFVAGPSRTADIEKVLVLGAHGPRRLCVVLVDNI